MLDLKINLPTIIIITIIPVGNNLVTNIFSPFIFYILREEEGDKQTPPLFLKEAIDDYIKSKIFFVIVGLMKYSNSDNTPLIYIF